MKINNALGKTLLSSWNLLLLDLLNPENNEHEQVMVLMLIATLNFKHLAIKYLFDRWSDMRFNLCIFHIAVFVTKNMHVQKQYQE